MKGHSLHYILYFGGFVGEGKIEVLEQNGKVFFRFADRAHADGLGMFYGDKNIKATYFRHLFQEFAWCGFQSAFTHPLLKGAPHDEAQEADENMGLRTIFTLMEDRAQPKVMLTDAETVFDLCQADVCFPEEGGVVSLEVCTQEIATIGIFDPFAKVVASGDSQAIENP